MDSSSITAESVLELVVMAFQLCGVVALCVTRLISHARWAERGRIAFVIAMVGLGVAGAICGRHDSEFALFAGGTMTALLIGMTIGNGAPDTARITQTPPLQEIPAVA